MSLGEVSGLAQIMKVSFKGGLGEKNEAVLEGSIELAGKLRSFFGEKFSEMSESARILLVDIGFSKEQESDAAHSTAQNQYVGIVHFDKGPNKGVRPLCFPYHAIIMFRSLIANSGSPIS